MRRSVVVPPWAAAIVPVSKSSDEAVPATVQAERDLVYARYGTREVKLDLYLPRVRPTAAIPCIVVVHGGGWRSGDKSCSPSLNTG